LKLGKIILGISGNILIEIPHYYIISPLIYYIFG
jgi:hypothetical protein